VQDDGDGNEQLNAQNNAVWLTELRQGRAIVADALDAIQLNGYHAHS